MLRTLILLALLAMFSAACDNDLVQDERPLPQLRADVETAYDVEILYSDSARIRVRIKGPVMLNYLDRRSPRQEFPEGLSVDFYDEQEQITSHLDANYGIRYQDEALVVVKDSVVWKSVEGEKLETEELRWDERQQKIFTNKYVVITRPDEIIRGYGFEANQNFSYSRIKAIDGRIKLEEMDEALE